MDTLDQDPSPTFSVLTNVLTRRFHSAVAIFKIPVAKLEQRMSLNVTDLLLNMQRVFCLNYALIYF